MATAQTRRRGTKYMLPVPDAGRIAFGIGYTASYEAARRGELPTVKVNGRLWVPVAALEQLIGCSIDIDAVRRESDGEAVR